MLTVERTIAGNGEQNKLQLEDRPAHDWYRFVLSFPPHLIRDYLERFRVKRGECVLDPFCGTGTTLVECKKLGVTSVGVEANPLAYSPAVRRRRTANAPPLRAERAADELPREGVESDGMNVAYQASVRDTRHFLAMAL